MSTGCAGVEDLVAGALPGSDDGSGGVIGSTNGDRFMARLGKSFAIPPAAAVVVSNAVTFGVDNVIDRGRVMREERLGLIDVGCACACSVEVQVGAAAVVELMMLVAGLWGGAGDDAEEELYGDAAVAGAAALRMGIASRDVLLVPAVAADAASAPCCDDADELAGRAG
jgi:hypothetical protein